MRPACVIKKLPRSKKIQPSTQEAIYKKMMGAISKIVKSSRKKYNIGFIKYYPKITSVGKPITLEVAIELKTKPKFKHHYEFKIRNGKLYIVKKRKKRRGK